MKWFIGTCIENPFDRIELLTEITEKAEPISKREFLDASYVDEEIVENMDKYEQNYEFFRYNGIYFYRWSNIEYFYE